MALVVSTLSAALKAINAAAAAGNGLTADQWADQTADAIDAYIKTATVTTPLGVAVQVVPATGTGATTAPGIGSIS